MTDGVRLARSAAEIEAAYAVRYAVFVVEQGVPSELELDALDPHADHFVVYSGFDIVGAGRLVVEPPGYADADQSLGPVGHLGRLAVLAAARGRGHGIELVRAIEARAGSRSLRHLVLAAQVGAIEFYTRLGYLAYGEQFDDAGLQHRWMCKAL